MDHHGHVLGTLRDRKTRQSTGDWKLDHLSYLAFRWTSINASSLRDILGLLRKARRPTHCPSGTPFEPPELGMYGTEAKWRRQRVSRYARLDIWTDFGPCPCSCGAGLMILCQRNSTDSLSQQTGYSRTTWWVLFGPVRRCKPRFWQLRAAGHRTLSIYEFGTRALHSLLSMSQMGG